MVRRLAFLLVLVGLLGLATAPAVSAAPPARGDSLTQELTGTLNGAPWTGTVTVNEIQRVGDELVANVTVAGGGFTQSGVVPLQVSQACDILTLDLGPLHLDLLGLVVDLSMVNLDITAVPGPGNLLGNLLCAVAGLLDGPSPLGQLIDRLLGIINGLLG
jgi:hypothetical protein